MPKHTPGPWHRNIKPASKYCTVWGGRNTHVAYVAVKGLSESEIEANIDLIHAAPELLKALTDLAEYVNAYVGVDELGQSLLDASKAAIDKAQGTA